MIKEKMIKENLNHYDLPHDTVTGPSKFVTNCTKVDGFKRDVFSGYMSVGDDKSSALFYIFYPAKNKK